MSVAQAGGGGVRLQELISICANVATYGALVAVSLLVWWGLLRWMGLWGGR